MTAKQASGLNLKDEILMLLSDAEIGRVSMAETKKSLSASEQYIDLDDISSGVHTVGEGGVAALADILPRNAVAPATWDKILEKISR